MRCDTAREGTRVRKREGEGERLAAQGRKESGKGAYPCLCVQVSVGPLPCDCIVRALCVRKLGLSGLALRTFCDPLKVTLSDIDQEVLVQCRTIIELCTSILPAPSVAYASNCYGSPDSATMRMPCGGCLSMGWGECVSGESTL